MAKIVTLTGLRKASLRKSSCSRVVKSPMRTLSGEEMYVCADGDVNGVIEDGSMAGIGEVYPDPAQLFTAPTASRTSPFRRGGGGRPRGTYGARRGGYVDPKTGMRKVAKMPKRVACNMTPNGVYWDYNDNPQSKFHGQFRCRCRTVAASGKANTGYVPNSYCERMNLPKDPAVSQQIRDQLESSRPPERRRTRRRK